MLAKPGVVDRSQPASFLIHTSGKETDMATQRISAYQYWIVFGGAESVWAVLVGTWWYWVCINLVVLGIKCNWVRTKLLCLYILKKVEIWSDVTIAGRRTNVQTRKDRATQPMDHGRLR